MVVLEAQACGLPALVTGVGGPKEIILHETTGYVMPETTVEAWNAGIQRAIRMMETDPEAFNAMKTAARSNVVSLCDWEAVLRDVMGEELLTNPSQDTIEIERSRIAAQVAA
jgi:glycosyltransferase involved in cell wall biosynthesis